MKIFSFLGYVFFCLLLIMFAGQTTLILTKKEQTFSMENPLLAIVTGLLILIIVYCEYKINKNKKF